MPPEDAIDDHRLHQLLGTLVERHRIPGAVLGVFDGNRTVSVGAGTANLNTGAAMTADTRFLLGSVTKVWIATLTMSMVDAGELDLDEPVRRYLPDFRLADDQAAAAVTVRQLLTHTSGIDAADYAPDDLGNCDNAVADYVSRLSDVGQLHPPGAMWSYCNPGFVIVGRIIETLTGAAYGCAVRDRLLHPAGLTSTVLSVDDAVLQPLAVGHFPASDGSSHVATSRFLLPRCLGPAGSTLITTVDDVLRFARLHLANGRTDGGAELVAATSIKEMAAHQIDLPVPELGSFGLGWARNDRGETLVLSHTGGSVGGLSQLVLAPELGVGYAAFANSAASVEFHADLRQDVLNLLHVPQPPMPQARGRPEPAEFFTGDYQRRDVDTTIDADRAELVVTIRPTGSVLGTYTNSSETVVRCQPIGRGTLGHPSADGAEPVPLGYAVGEVDGHPSFLFVGGRLSRRVAAASG